MREAVIAGVFQTPQQKRVVASSADLWWECARGACEDAGLSLADVEGLVGGGPAGVPLRNPMPGAALGYDLLGKPLRFHAASSIGASSAAAGINLAMYAVSAGLADTVLIVNAVSDDSEISDQESRDAAVARMGRLSGPYEYPAGGTRASDYAVLARRHMHEFGTTPEQLAEVAVSQRLGATLHPLSVYGSRGTITVDDVLESRMIADPLRLLDCCAVNEGGGAVLVTTAEHARANGRSTVSLLGYGEGHSHIDPNALPSLCVFPAAQLAAETAFGLAGITPDEIDVAGIGDHFTVNVLFGLESAGFCKPGEGGSFVEGGGLSIGGRLPTNTSGGFLSFSHAGQCGIFTLIEVVEQLRGNAGARQVADATYGYLNGVGGAMQTNFSAILGVI